MNRDYYNATKAAELAQKAIDAYATATDGDTPRHIRACFADSMPASHAIAASAKLDDEPGIYADGFRGAVYDWIECRESTKIAEFLAPLENENWVLTPIDPRGVFVAGAELLHAASGRTLGFYLDPEAKHDDEFTIAGDALGDEYEIWGMDAEAFARLQELRDA